MTWQPDTLFGHAYDIELITKADKVIKEYQESEKDEPEVMKEAYAAAITKAVETAKKFEPVKDQETNGSMQQPIMKQQPNPIAEQLHYLQIIEGTTRYYPIRLDESGAEQALNNVIMCIGDRLNKLERKGK